MLSSHVKFPACRQTDRKTDRRTDRHMDTCKPICPDLSMHKKLVHMSACIDCARWLTSTLRFTRYDLLLLTLQLADS